MRPLYALPLLILVSFNTYAQSLSDEAFENIKFRFIGPEGNRAIAVAGVPGNEDISYIGAASGGLWKTTDRGLNWEPIFDDQEASSIGSVALAPSDPDQVWVGTGETFVIRPAHAMGDGIYKSSDAGATWTNMGLEKSGRIGRVIIHPTDTNIVYAAVLGHTYGPQQDKGVYKTTDGGKSWKKILFVDEGTGAADLAMDPQNPDILYAAMWSININTWGLRSGGAGGGIYKSVDGGESWEPMTKNGLPGGKDHPVGKTAVAVSHSNPNVVYALFEIESPALYRSDDKGESWTLQTRNHDIAERAPYYTRIGVGTDNPDEVYCMSVKFSKSVDGGKTFKSGYQAGGDNHDIWIDPELPNRIMVAHDGCASISYNGGESYQRIVLPIAQMYHVATDDQIPYNVFGNRQDGYSYMGPSNSLQGYIPLGLWEGVGGCESGFAKPDPVDNTIIWSGCYDGGLERYDLKTGISRDVRVWPEAGYGWAPKDMKYRWHWNFPLSFSTFSKHRVYVGSQFVHKSDDGGQSWQIISPDLTLNRKDHQESSGGVAIDNLMTFDGSTLFAIEESPIEAGVIWVGSNDGQVNITRNGGESWENVTANFNGLPEWGTVANIEPSKYKKGKAYVTIDLHQMGDFGTYVYLTEDYGKSWKKISNSIPQSVHGFAHCVREDKKKEGVLYLGVDNGLYISVNEGADWFKMKNNLPPAPVYWIDHQERFDDLVVGTYGRGYYIFDNISVVREYAEKVNNDHYLFPQREAYRFNTRQSIKTDGPSLNNGSNPRYGADINYYLTDSLEAFITVENTQGEEIRRLDVTKNGAGLNRVFWDLRYEPTYKPKIRTTPPGRPWAQLNGEGWRPLVTWDLDLWRGQFGPRVLPGDYVVKLHVDGKEYTQTLKVLADPKSENSIEDMTKQLALGLELRDAMNLAVVSINKVEVIRAELADIILKLTNKNDLEVARQIDAKATSIASKLYDIQLTGAREDAFRNPMMLYGRLSALASDLIGNGADFPPTDQQVEVKGILKKRLDQVMSDLEALIEKDIASFNKRLNKKDKIINLENKSQE
ncbi:glycosyl hydrolase [Fulvivirga sp.]|uniref:WD40/YVTN/BNR-like repeat-containing protein n=1 Tax=Fulvivirga sp. TaxID=1931237 RepID=UPI0032EE1237